MKKLIATLALSSLAFSNLVHAQADPKVEWATKVVQLQQGPELDRLVNQLAASTAQDLISNWGPRLEANVPKARQPKASEDLNVELKSYADDTSQLIAKQVNKVSMETLVPAYEERFTLEELKEIAAFFESPAIKKFQTNSPQLGEIFVQKLIEASRPDVLARVKQFDGAAVKIIGTGPANATSPAAPKAGKPAAKK